MKLCVPYGRGSAGRCDVIAKLIEILAQERHKTAGFLKVCSSILPFRTPRYRTLQTEIILSDNHEIETLKSDNKNNFLCTVFSFVGCRLDRTFHNLRCLGDTFVTCKVGVSVQLTDEVRPEAPVPLPQLGGFQVT